MSDLARLGACAAISIVGHFVLTEGLRSLPPHKDEAPPQKITIRVVAPPAPEPPPEPPKPPEVPPTTLAITLTKDGELYLNQHPTTPEALRAAVRDAIAKDAKTQAIIIGDKAVPHGRVVWVLDTVKSLGVASFAIQIDPVGS